MGKLNKIIFPLPVGFKDNYPDEENQALFNEDTLVLPVFIENYNAPNPFQRSVKEGVNGAVVDFVTDYYEPEILCLDSRSIIKTILDDLNLLGNLSTQGAILSNSDVPAIVMYDQHEFDSQSDRDRGYTIRVGTMEIESLKGSFRSSSGDNHGKGTKIKFFHLYNIIGSNLTDARIDLNR